MSAQEAKWMLSGTLLVVLMAAIGANRALFSAPEANLQTVTAQERSVRNLASVRPLMKISWEERAFEVLKDPQREPANLAAPALPYEKFAFGFLEGHYQVRERDGRIAQVVFADREGQKPKSFKGRGEFFSSHLSLFSGKAEKAIRVHVEDNDQLIMEKYSLVDGQGQDQGTVQVLMDKNQNLISMTVL